MCYPTFSLGVSPSNEIQVRDMVDRTCFDGGPTEEGCKGDQPEVSKEERRTRPWFSGQISSAGRRSRL